MEADRKGEYPDQHRSRSRSEVFPRITSGIVETVIITSTLLNCCMGFNHFRPMDQRRAEMLAVWEKPYHKRLLPEEEILVA